MKNLSNYPTILRQALETNTLTLSDVSLPLMPQVTDCHSLLKICALIDEENYISGLEVGSLIGLSTVFLGTALRQNGGSLTSIDPGRGREKWGDDFIDDPMSIARKLVKECGLVECVNFITGYSQHTLFTVSQQIDFAYIDGDHNYFSVLQDFIVVDSLMKIGGTIVLDDIAKEMAQKEWTDGGPARLLGDIFATTRYEMKMLSHNLMACRKIRGLG